MGSIIVAAGGGGDVITSAALGRPLGLTPPIVIMSYSWDRLMIDPVPGPRSVDEFTGLKLLAPLVNEVTGSTQAVPPAGSSLPRLARELPIRLILLDPTGGASGMAGQITATADHFDADNLVLVDVGGDALTNGSEPGLRSPLADQLAIAACLRTGLPTRLVIAAPAVDGELEPGTLEQRLSAFNATRLPDLTGQDLDGSRGVFTWHPSEASGLLAAAASGLRGQVEVRDAGTQIMLTDATTSLHALEAAHFADAVPAHALIDTHSLTEAEATIRKLTGISEIEYETDKARRRDRQRSHTVTQDDLVAVDNQAHEAAGRGSDYISMRRLAELTGATTLDSFATLNRLLARERPRQYATSVYAAG